MINRLKVNDFLVSLVINSHNMQVYESIMRKYEIQKKIYTTYNKDFKKALSAVEISKKQYQLLAICFLLCFVQNKDIRFYNTALKIGDKINFQLPNLSLD